MAKRVFELGVREWSAPIESAYGYHLVWIHTHQPARQRELKEVEKDVREEILDRRAAEALRKDGRTIATLRVTPSGVADLAHLEELLQRH